MEKKRRKSVWKKISTYIMMLSAAISVVFCIQLVMLAMLPNKYLIPSIAVVFIMNTLAAYLLWGNPVKSWMRHGGEVIAILMSVLLLLGNVGIYIVNDIFNQVTEIEPQREGVSLVVMKGSSLEKLTDLKEEDLVGIQAEIYRPSAEQMLADMEKTLSFDVAAVEYHRLTEPVEALYHGEISAMILNEAYRDLIRDSYANFDVETKVIYNYMYVLEQKNVSKKINVSEDAFTVLITGIDTYGGISTVSRSDVNILATVNPATHQILLTSIPRDYYVPFISGARSIGGAEGQKDKLTHTGLFGADCTMKTLENLFGIDINYYIRVNFSSLIKIIDAIGGVTVESDVAFGTFRAGENHLNGKEALAFARDRHSFQSGDRQRGKNQMKVIEAIIKKAAAPDFSNDYMELFHTVSSTVEMNFSDAEIKSLVRMQVEDMRGWNVLAVSVDGTGAEDYSYVYGANLYVMYPDETTVQRAKEQMDAVIGME